MTLKLIDSGDGQRTYDATKWSGNTGSPTWNSAPSGQSGTWFTLSNSGQRRWQDVSLSGDTLILGFRVELPSSLSGETPLAIFGEWDGSANTQHLYIGILSTGFQLRQGASNAGTIGGVQGTPLAFGSGCRYIEVKVKVHDSAGTVEIRQDEVVLLSVSGIDTRQGDTGICNSISILSATASNTSTNWKFRDVYICDTAGSVNNNFLGVFKTGVKTVSGAGNSAQFTPSAGSNFQNVDDGATVDNDTTYNFSSNVGDTDTFALTSSGLASSAVIRGTQTSVIMRKDDIDPRSGATVIRSGGTSYPQTSLSLGTSYVQNQLIQELDPDTSVTWIQSGLDAIELGYKVAA
jgi:hypothetical protein